MALTQIHGALANTATMFLAVLGIWALLLRFRSQPLSSGWSGAAVIGEILLIAQFALGWVLFFQGYGSELPRAWIHILYGVVAIITLPAAHTYFSNIKEPNVQTLAMAFVCIFLWGIVLRSAQVVYMQVPY